MSLGIFVAINVFLDLGYYFFEFHGNLDPPNNLVFAYKHLLKKDSPLHIFYFGIPNFYGIPHNDIFATSVLMILVILVINLIVFILSLVLGQSYSDSGPFFVGSQLLTYVNIFTIIVSKIYERSESNACWKYMESDSYTNEEYYKIVEEVKKEYPYFLKIKEKLAVRKIKNKLKYYNENLFCSFNNCLVCSLTE